MTNETPTPDPEQGGKPKEGTTVLSPKEIIDAYDSWQLSEQPMDGYEAEAEQLLHQAMVHLRILAAAPTEADIMKPVNFKPGCFGMRADIELVKLKIKNWLAHPELVSQDLADNPLGKRCEMYDNLLLAYRHLEDARMRVGKAVQAYDGGKSVYPQ